MPWAYNLANFLRSRVLPNEVDRWSLTTLREKLIKTGARIVRHGRYVVFSWPKSPCRGRCSRPSCGGSIGYGHGRRRSRYERRGSTLDGDPTGEVRSGSTESGRIPPRGGARASRRRSLRSPGLVRALAGLPDAA